MEFVEERLAWLEEKADKWAELQVIVHEQAEQIVKLMADRDALREQLQFVQGKADEALEKCATLTRAVGRDALGVGAAKIKPPKPRDYSGARDAKEVDNFLFDMEQYFRICQLSDDQKVDTAIMYLSEDAKLWWRTKHADIEAGRIKIDTWAEFKEELKEQFYPVNTAFVARMKLQECRQKGSLRNYVKEYSAIMLDITDMNEKDRVFNFVNGLKEWAQREILRQNIDTLAAAMCAAERLMDYSVGKGRQSEKDSSGTSTRSNSPSPSSPKGTENGSRVSSNTINTYHRRSGGGDAQRQTSTPSHNSGNSRAGASSANTRAINCILCRGPHKWWDCEHKEELDKIQKRLSSMSVQEATKETSSDEEPTYRMGSIRRLSAMRMIAPQEEPEVRYLSAMRVMEPEKKATSKKQARTRNPEKREMKPMELATSQIHTRQNQNQSQGSKQRATSPETPKRHQRRTSQEGGKTVVEQTTQGACKGLQRKWSPKRHQPQLEALHHSLKEAAPQQMMVEAAVPLNSTDSTPRRKFRDEALNKMFEPSDSRDKLLVNKEDPAQESDKIPEDSRTNGASET